LIESLEPISPHNLTPIIFQFNFPAEVFFAAFKGGLKFFRPRLDKKGLKIYYSRVLISRKLAQVPIVFGWSLSESEDF
jgi:hypothetical protein